MIVGFTGKARSGKDTAADILQVHTTDIYKKFSFADPMKKACQVMFGWDRRHTFGELKDKVDKHYNFSPRYALQTLGTDWGRKLLGEDIWLRVADAHLHNGCNWIIPDVRFDNEAQFILDKGGCVIRVERGNIQEVSAHESENGVDDGLVSAVLDNNGTMKDLIKQVDKLICRFGL